MLRLNGALLLRLNRATSWSDAEVCFREAIDVANRQQARVLSLRATASLARLWQLQGKSTEARSALSAAYSSFSEGFETNDLREARALLEVLANDGKAD